MKEIKDRQGRLTIVLLALIALTVLVLLFLNYSEKNIEINVDTGETAVIDDKYTVVCEGESLSFYDKKGGLYKKLERVKSYTYQAGYLYILAENKIAKIDYKGQALQSVTFQDSIDRLLSNDKLLIAVGKEKAYFLKDLKTVEEFDQREEKIALTQSYGDDYAVSTVGLREGRLFSKLYMYDDKGLYYKNIFIDNPILYLGAQEDQLLVAGKEYILKFNKASPDYKNEFGGLKAIGTDDKYTYLIDYADNLFILDKELNLVYNEKLDGEYMIYSNKAGTVLYNENGYMVFDSDKLIKTPTEKLKYITGEEDFYLAYENKIERMK
ncbi:MAG: hypothetical protein SPI59_00845 [Finegoldia sp.]|nr:hypothetical protein [Finegoldia sp.]